MNEERPIAIYNCDEKKLVFICCNVNEATKIIYSNYLRKDSCKILFHLNNTGLIKAKSNKLGYLVKVKDATIEQRKLLSSSGNKVLQL